MQYITLKRKAWHIVSVILPALLFVSINSLADETNKVRFLTEELKPFQYYSGGQLVGINIAKVRKAISLSELKNATIELYPWARSYQTTLRIPDTFIFSMVRTEAREDMFIWVCQLDRQQYAFYGLSERAIDIKSIEDIKGFKTVVMIDDLVHRLLLNKGFDENFNLIVLSNIQSIFKMFYAGKADFIVANAPTFRAMASEMGHSADDWIPILQIPELETGHYLAANKQTDSRIIEKVRSAFEKIQQSNGGCQY